MENAESIETFEVSDIDGQQLFDAVNIHARCQLRVMHLHALNIMRDQQRPPSIVNFPAVREEFEIPLDHSAKRSVSETLKPKPFLSSGRVEAFQNSASVWDV
jgi:hypothetical protein